MKRIIMIMAAIAMMFGLSGCYVQAQSDEAIAQKGGGIWEAPTAKACIQPAEKVMEKPGDNYYTYPAGQRFYDFSKPVGEGADGDPFQVISSDNQPFTVKGLLFFQLNTECNTLQQFHDRIGARDGGAYSNSETGAQGWSKVLNTYMRPALEATLDRVAKQYTWKQLYSDLKVRDQLNSEVNEKIRDLVNKQIGGDDDFFINYSAQIQQPIAPKPLIDAMLAEESSIAQGNATKIAAKAEADAATAKSQAQIAQKEAELKVQRLQSDIEAAKIAPYGSVREYNNYLAIQRGLNPYQPVYGAGVLVDGTK